MPTRDSFAPRLPLPLPVRGGRTLTTVADARAFVLALPPERAENPRWERAAELMLKGASTDAIWQALRLALFHDGSLDLSRAEERDQRGLRHGTATSERRANAQRLSAQIFPKANFPQARMCSAADTGNRLFTESAHGSGCQ
jgi:hypothetical protein